MGVRIKRLHMGDFGILRNQTLEDLHPRLVVVGGPNRAGKSTFMQVLRYLGYGIPSGGSMPPANVEYLAEADMTDDGKNLSYHIRLQGLSGPVCTLAGKGDRIPVSDLYSMDAFTYHNLFTISLDQLTRIPEGISKNEFDKLQAVILGAGFTDIANIPGLEERFSKSAASIGGSTGRLNNKGFRPYVKTIEEGSRKKKKALGQVDDYQRQQTRLSELHSQQEGLKIRLADLYPKRILLEAVKGNYDLLEELTELNSQLENHVGASISSNLPLENRSNVMASYERYMELKGIWEQDHQELMKGMGDREQNHLLPKILLQHQDALQSYFDQLSGLEVRWDTLMDTKKDWEETRHEILGRMQSLHRGWSMADMDHIRELPLEHLAESRLMEKVSRFQKSEGQLERTEAQLGETQLSIDGLQTQKAEWQKQASRTGLKLYFAIAALCVLIGVAVSFLHQPSGLLLGGLGIAGTALVTFYHGMGQKEAEIRLKDIQAKLDASLAQQDKLRQRLLGLSQGLSDAEEELGSEKEKLGLGAVKLPSPNSLPEYYRSLKSIQDRIRGLDRMEDETEEQSEYLGRQFYGIQTLLSQLEIPNSFSLKSKEDENITQDVWMRLQSQLKKWNQRLQTAIHLNRLSLELERTGDKLRKLIGFEVKEEVDQSKMQLEDQVESYLGQCESRSDYLEKERRKAALHQSLERVASSLHQFRSKDISTLEGFLRVFRGYPARESLEREYTGLVQLIQDEEEELEACKKETHKSNLLLEQLSLTDELEEGHLMIQQGRRGLYQVSYDYGVQKTAAWLCREIRNGFLEKTKDELLQQADGIFKQLTDGEYSRMIPKEDLTDFSFLRKDGSLQDNSSVLSRGTREQVFLAMRLGRILDSKAALPVIIDDSFVNFDPAHTRQALSVLSRLCESHQVFIMTCHPHLIDLLMEMNREAQYWHLDHGRFTLTVGQNLRETLQFPHLSC